MGDRGCAKCQPFVQNILHGRRDLSELRGPLAALEHGYESAIDVLHSQQGKRAVRPEVLVLFARALEGLAEIGVNFADGDAQHIEDGWHQLFESD